MLIEDPAAVASRILYSLLKRFEALSRWCYSNHRTRVFKLHMAARKTDGITLGTVVRFKAANEAFVWDDKASPERTQIARILGLRFQQTPTDGSAPCAVPCIAGMGNMRMAAVCLSSRGCKAQEAGSCRFVGIGLSDKWML